MKNHRRNSRRIDHFINWGIPKIIIESFLELGHDRAAHRPERSFLDEHPYVSYLEMVYREDFNLSGPLFPK